MVMEMDELSNIATPSSYPPTRESKDSVKIQVRNTQDLAKALRDLVEVARHLVKALRHLVKGVALLLQACFVMLSSLS